MLSNDLHTKRGPLAVQPKQIGLILLTLAITLLSSACGGGASSNEAGSANPTTTTTITGSTTTSTLPGRTFNEGTVQSWNRSVAYLPGDGARVALEDIPSGRSYPVLIFMHGCAGYSTAEHTNWGSYLARNGILVIMPDSYNRPDRPPPECGDLTEQGGPYPPIHDMRLDEIDYASRQIMNQPWYDGKNLLLMGYSEGAIAAVRTPLARFRGVVATSWTCTHWNVPRLHGIYLPSATPLLTLRREVDAWFTSDALNGNCGERMGGRADSRNIMVPGEGHGTYDDASARQQVLSFFQRVIAN